jgi:hypothetical protein
MDAREKAIQAIQAGIHAIRIGWLPNAETHLKDALAALEDDATVPRESLWQKCFWEIAKKAKSRGDIVIEFSEVDALVIECSKEQTDE